MNYKELFNKMAFLLSSPSRFWEKEATEGQGSRMMSEYVYPFIGLCGLSEFIGTFIGRDVSTEFFQWALTRCCAIAVSLFGGFFVAGSKGEPTVFFEIFLSALKEMRRNKL